MSFFITFEGVEGSGKTTQMKRLKKYLARRGIPCICTREPGGTRIGEEIRKILLNRRHRKMDPLSELFLYEAARAQHVMDVIKPLMKRKRVVILCDRFRDASVAYQGYGRGIDPKWVEELNRTASHGIKPDLTFLLDCPSDMGLKRALERDRQKRSSQEDRFEREKIQFHLRVRRGYRALAKKEPHRIRVIDTRPGKDKVFDRIRKVVDERMGLEGSRA